MKKTLSESKQLEDIQKLNTEAEKEYGKLIKDLDLLLLLYILKTTTNEEHVMSVSELAEQLDHLIPSYSGISYFPDRTIRRRLEIFTNVESFPVDFIQKINQLLPFVFGGRIASRATDAIMYGTNTKSSGKQKRFYFESVLSSGDMDLIWGSIKSNRFLSDEEKEYLLKRLHILLPDYSYDRNQLSENAYRHILQMNALPEKPKAKKEKILPMDSSALLSHIGTIYEAIENEQQLQVIYGTYDVTPHSPKVHFRPRNPEKPYVLNPYALLWNGGAYYLIATHGNYTNPVHFRVDRIISVKIHVIKNENGELEECKRKKIPAALKPFYTRDNNGKYYFDGIQYADTYPDMKLYEEERKIDVVFECTAGNLQIIIDHFGSELHLSASPIEHAKEEVDYNGKEQTFFSAKIKGVQYDNALRFAIAQSEYLTLLGPEDLLQDVAAKMQEIANRYQKYSHLI